MKTAVLGFGTVGKGIYEMLSRAPDMECGSVLVRPGKEDEEYKVSSIDDILHDPGTEAVAEALGGTEPAFSYAASALQSGKHFVTSNKALVAAHGLELSALARESGRAFLFSAACGGGMPFLHNLALAARTDEISELGGILNGTTNFMLDAMQRRNLAYVEALREAQALGYAEADPTADVSGLDALRKIMLACAVGLDVLPTEGLRSEGIESVSREDVEDFKARRLTCRLLARAGAIESGGVYAYVEPVLLPEGSPECSVLNNYNMARYKGRYSGDMVFMGQGAGRYPTASAVLRDLSSIAGGEYQMLRESCHTGYAANSRCKHSYYVRLPEVMAGTLPARDVEARDGVARVITRPVSVKQMHSFAGELRSAGAELFFAGLEDEA